MNNPRISRMAALLLTALLMLLLAAGCGGKKDNGGAVEQETEPEAPVVMEEPEPEPEKPSIFAPLTGMPRDQEAKLRPLAVIINNLAPARPQSGLPHADVVWEVLAEGGITRLIAIFQSDEAYDGAVGPIRSIRPYMIELAESYNAVIVHAGGSNDAYAILKRQKKEYLDEITNAGTWFRRDSSRKAPHNLYSDLPNLRAGAEKKGYPADVEIPAYLFLDDDGNGAPAGKALEIDIRFQLKNYIVTYRYDAGKTPISPVHQRRAAHRSGQRRAACGDECGGARRVAQGARRRGAAGGRPGLRRSGHAVPARRSDRMHVGARRGRRHPADERRGGAALRAGNGLLSPRAGSEIGGGPRDDQAAGRRVTAGNRPRGLHLLST